MINIKEINKFFFFNILLIIIISTLISITVFSLMDINTVNQINSQIVNVEQNNIFETNINTASQKELENLPGIGEKLAKEIIKNRPYSSIYDLQKIDGIGYRTVKNIENEVIVK